MLTPKRITPEPFQFLVTPLALNIASKQWRESITQGLESGASYSQGFPLTSSEECNEIGQKYQAPVVLITDALCYSAADIFAAGFQDHQIGTILGCHSSTGAGGANVWNYSELRKMTQKLENPFLDLPAGANMRVAARRCTRVGDRSGMPVEEYGVVPDIRYFMTKKDIIGYNDDLIAAAASVLKPCPQQSLTLIPDPASRFQKFLIDCSGINQIDLFVNERPALSQEVSGSRTRWSIVLPFAAEAGSVLRAEGYRKGVLVVRTRLTVGP